MDKRIEKLPEDQQLEIINFINKSIKHGLSGSLLDSAINVQIKHLEKQNRIRNELAHNKAAPEINAPVTNLIDTTASTKPQTETELQSTQSPFAELIATQCKSDIRYNYTPFIQLTLPYSDDYSQSRTHPKPFLRYQRTNNLSAITWSSSMPEWGELESRFTNNKNQLALVDYIVDQPPGLPSGLAPRFLLAYIYTQFKLTGDPVINLGNSIRDVMSLMGIKPQAGKGRNVYQWTLQLYRLIYTNFSITNIDESKTGELLLDVKNQSLFSSSKLWLDEDYNGKAFVKISEDFSAEVYDHLAPIDIRIMAKLYNKKNCLAVDLFTWSQYRIANSLKTRDHTPIFISLEQAYKQFGNQNNHIAMFRTQLIKAISTIDSVVGELNPLSFNVTKKTNQLYETKIEKLILKPSTGLTVNPVLT